MFDTEAEFHDFRARRYPPLPQRRAFFVESDTRLAVYAHWNDRVADDLRHEVTHGYLHSVAPHIPLWIDEGLAEYYEVPRGRRGLNAVHVSDLAARIAEGTWHPDLPRLESMRRVDDMNQTDYAEAWAWVHLLLETTSDRHQLLREYLSAVRRHGQAEPLSAALSRQLADPNQALVTHVRSLAMAEP